MKNALILGGLMSVFFFAGLAQASDEPPAQKPTKAAERMQKTPTETELSPMADLVNSIDACDSN